MDTDQCIQKLVRTDQEGSERTQHKIEETVQYWAAQEKKAAMNYHCALELNNTVSNKRVQQLYSQDQPQEAIDQAEQQAGSVRRTLENIQRVDEARLSRNSPKHLGHQGQQEGINTMPKMIHKYRTGKCKSE